MCVRAHEKNFQEASVCVCLAKKIAYMNVVHSRTLFGLTYGVQLRYIKQLKISSCRAYYEAKTIKLLKQKRCHQQPQKYTHQINWKLYGIERTVEEKNI